MAIRIERYVQEHERSVRAFNARLAAGGAALSFPSRCSCTRFPGGRNQGLYQEMFVALDDGDTVRGGYFLKHQPFFLGGRRRSVAEYTFPLSEGVIDRHYGLLGVSMVLDAQKRESLLYGLGMGGEGHPSVRVMKGLGWSAMSVPFYFRVLRPYRFLRNIEHLRRKPFARHALDLAAFTGMGWAGVRAFDLLARDRTVRGVIYERVKGFGNWADEVWDSAHGVKGLVAVRNRRTLTLLYPPADPRYIVVRIASARGTAGWAVCLATQMRDSAYFGNMRVGTLVDVLARPADISRVVEAAGQELAQRGVDVIVSNQSHQGWREALKSAGYLPGPSNYILTCSPALTAVLGSFENGCGHCHINRGDGDGPIHL